MVYQGSKDRIAKFIVPIIQNYINAYHIKNYYEPFVGGANVIDKVICENKTGSDYNEYLIKLLRYIQQDNHISIAPENCTFEHYSEVRDSYRKRDGRFSDEYISLIGYCASYGGRFFDGGYARDRTGRNMYQERIKNLREQARKLYGISFECRSYTTINPNEYVGCLFYLDPPYNNTKAYSKQDIDYNFFYNWCRALSKNNIVLISEYNMPPDFTCIWCKERNIMQKSDRLVADKAVEKLFMKITP